MNHNNEDEKKENKNIEELHLSTFKNIKNIKLKKLLLSNFVNNINNDIYNENVIDEIIKQKNKLLLKSICSNLKYINEDNIILNSNRIIYIVGININNNGLINIDKVLYKNNKIPK